MILNRLFLKRFRNYEELSLQGFSPELNIIRGKNAQGKTNIIEAVHICSFSRSFRTPYDYTTVREGCDSAYILTGYQSETGAGTIEALIEKNKKKSFKKNGVPLKSAKQLFSNLLTVIFSPEDIRTVREAPSLRRSFLDAEISKIRPAYVDTVKRYAEIVSQKNAAIKEKGQGAAEVLRAYNAKLADYIRVITENRVAYANMLNSILAETHAQISGSSEETRVIYKTQRAENIEAWLESLVNKEISEYGCNYGPHKDELKFLIDGRDARQYASQGQLRTLMLAVKISCVKILENGGGKKPVLLLDDVFSELDAGRKKNLLKAIRGVQTFITGCEHEIPSLKGDFALIDVKDGTARLT